ncbi:MAG: hypothetical protein JRG86_21560 [Deltaproteobacteria bacterium]|jgi:hypothetical protein|nr:hypothetical protein [Deltaproteobacteria bacterium]MBW2500457.1 hypothetical protein [Deltaproteobacteria bacterium]
MSSIRFSGYFLQPLSLLVEEWLGEGKLDEDELDNVLEPDARAVVDHGILLSEWAPLEVAESLVALVASQLGGETGLVDWAREIAIDWRDREPMSDLIQRAAGLVDAPGFVVSHASAVLLCDADWHYEGGRTHFAVSLRGVEAARPELKALLGALLARLVDSVPGIDFDVRFSGIDGGALVVFGERAEETSLEFSSESRLHRAALIAPA